MKMKILFVLLACTFGFSSYAQKSEFFPNNSKQAISLANQDESIVKDIDENGVLHYYKKSIDENGNDTQYEVVYSYDEKSFISKEKYLSREEERRTPKRRKAKAVPRADTK